MGVGTQGVTIEEININESDPGKMCRVCFGIYQMNELTTVFKIFPNRCHTFFPNPRHPLHAHSTVAIKKMDHSLY